MNIDLNFLKDRPLSYSSLKEFSKSPSHYINYVFSKREPSKEMNMGSLIHLLLLQPDEFSKQFAVSPSVDRRTAVGKEKYNEFVAQSEGKSVVSEEELELANQICSRLLSNGSVKTYIDSCTAYEQEWKADIHGLPFRGFIDGKADEYTIEIKTTSDASPDAFIRDFYNRKYHIQAALYYLATGLMPIYIVIETKAPYNFFIANIHLDYIGLGLKEVEDLANKFKECMTLSAWNTGYEFMQDAPIVIKAPSWVK